MKFNTQWQLPLLAVLLLTTNACKNKASKEVSLPTEAKLALIAATQAHAPAPDEYKMENEHLI
ncbi:hypothetical protein [Paraflavitalea speifideaquila]|uniref:hypothetical protein n=1 Tax=Paraflavitalea speifideaquila TaxID=3076558 RepID=UPI0028EE6B0D|nr:hypothetical protein [Paraflavitalea speifideiaquila]